MRIPLLMAAGVAGPVRQKPVLAAQPTPFASSSITARKTLRVLAKEIKADLESGLEGGNWMETRVEKRNRFFLPKIFNSNGELEKLCLQNKAKMLKAPW